jgi:hypothetical protein
MHQPDHGAQAEPMTLSTELFELGLGLLYDIVREPESGLSEEFEASRRQFFGPQGAPQDGLKGASRDDAQNSVCGARGESASKSADRRHLEWFLFEHAPAARAALVVEELLDTWRSRAPARLCEKTEAFLQSVTGIYTVMQSEAEAPVVLRCMTGMGSLGLGGAQTRGVLHPGDLVVGRLFPLGDGLHHLSPAAGIFRDPRLLAAIERDLEALRASRSRKIMRLSQFELESMFFGGGGSLAEATVDTNALEELREFLKLSGIPAEQVATWFKALGRRPCAADSLTPGVGDSLAEVLETLAFDSDLDLDRARALLLAALPALQGPDSGPSTAPAASHGDGNDHVAAAIKDFDRDRAAGLDVESSFLALESKLGLDDDDSDDDSEAPDFPGVVGAVVEEFLWETQAKEQKLHEGLRLFASYAHKIGVFENLGARDILSFAAFWVPESRQMKNGAEAERLMTALGAFGQWVVETHGIDVLDDELGDSLEHMRTSLPRAVVANALLPRVRDVEGELFAFVAAEGSDRGRIRDKAGVEREVSLPTQLASVLESGDLLRGFTRADGEFQVACCYPPQAAGLRV